MNYKLVKSSTNDIEQLIEYKKLGFNVVDETESRYYMKVCL